MIKLNLTNLKDIMTNVKEQIEMRDKILVGLEKVYKKLLETKKQQNLEIVVIKKGKIVRIKP